MSYIQINIGGKLRGLKFNQMSVILLAQYADMDNYAATAGYAMVYAGLKANCYVKREEADFTFEQVCDWIETIPADVMQKVYEVFSETQAYKNLLDKSEKDTEEPTKKNLTTTEMKATNLPLAS